MAARASTTPGAFLRVMQSTQLLPATDRCAYTVDTYAHGGRTLVQHYVVQGMGHAWSGSQSGLPFTDPKGRMQAQVSCAEPCTPPPHEPPRRAVGGLKKYCRWSLMRRGGHGARSIGHFSPTYKDVVL
ncbi:hypothetical protein CEK00_06330 [Stenotrophomonas maltophilia]|uniref:Uncharacterized protein n=1 Tax=Stenotrophomonas maltophilia TaxID=40324 RepID=A0A270NMW5_STEMA|nr:hypothetical protein CEK00_06330 [Stenotrophomonas maltophilia]